MILHHSLAIDEAIGGLNGLGTGMLHDGSQGDNILPPSMLLNTPSTHSYIAELTVPMNALQFNLAVVEAFVQLHEKGLIYRSSRPVNWSCHLRSALSDIEVDREAISGPAKISVPGYDDSIEFGHMYFVAYRVVSSATNPNVPGGRTGS